jgi:uncharacterized protein (TIGR03435 family)
VNQYSESWQRVPSPGRFEAQNSSLDELIRYAYNVKDYQVVGPPWLNDDDVCFDITARAATPAPRKEIPPMVQTLLTDRFHLVAHRETRTLSVLDLVPGKKPFRQAASAETRPSTMSRGGDVAATGVNMGDLAYQLSRYLKRPVFDATGIQGRYDLKFRYDASDPASLNGALQEQLGLRLESTKAPVEVLVIDSIDRKPTEN